MGGGSQKSRALCEWKVCLKHRKHKDSRKIICGVGNKQGSRDWIKIREHEKPIQEHSNYREEYSSAHFRFRNNTKMLWTPQVYEHRFEILDNSTIFKWIYQKLWECGR